MISEKQVFQSSPLSAGFLRSTGKINAEAVVHLGWVKGKTSSYQDKSARPSSIGRRRSIPTRQMARDI
ncbi:hypothetical protein FHT85_005408 [Rhizobium sp. BK312]|nr:hypothetical protein [Rhizobium sp. BK312]